MRKRIKLLLTLVLLCMTAQTAWADDIIYVSNTGDDTNDGSSEATALATIGKAVECATGGETIFIKNGEYEETQIITIGCNLTIEGESLDGVKLKNTPLRITANNVTVTGFTLNENKADFTTNDGAAIYVSSSNVTLDNISVTYNAPSEKEAKAIFANGADNFKLINSEITFTGANPEENHYRGLEVRDCDAAKIDNNTITATLPAVDVDWSGSGIGSNLVLAVGIQDGENIEFTNNTVTVNTNGSVGYYPTIDAVMIHSTDNILIKKNTITHLDTTTEDSPRYYYSLDIYSTTGTVEENNITVNTTTATNDVDRAGTAYAIQVTGPSTVTIKDNNITAISKGSVAGIYASNWDGYTDLTLDNNIIDVTGYATTANYALVAGVEADIDVLKAYNNTITVANGANDADYYDANQIIGVGIGNTWFYGAPIVDIKDNDITVDGKYAVYYATAENSNVIGNALRAHELTGDDAVYIGSGDNNTVASNLPLTANEANGSYWTTFFCSHTNYKINDAENATAYTAEVNGDNITLHSLNKDVPKNTAVIIKGADNKISMTKCEDPDLVIPTNHLHGVDVQTTTADIKTALGDGTFYVLGNTNSHFGFHQYTGTTMPARKAFLLLSGGGSSNFFGIDDETTGIQELKNGKIEELKSFFDLSGRRIANGQKPTAKGVYIVNGKKVIVK